MLDFRPLASSSAGNAYKLSCGLHAPLLIDCGLQFTRLQKALDFQKQELGIRQVSWQVDRDDASSRERHLPSEPGLDGLLSGGDRAGDGIGHRATFGVVPALMTAAGGRVAGEAAAIVKWTTRRSPSSLRASALRRVVVMRVDPVCDGRAPARSPDASAGYGT